MLLVILFLEAIPSQCALPSPPPVGTAGLARAAHGGGGAPFPWRLGQCLARCRQRRRQFVAVGSGLVVDALPGGSSWLGGGLVEGGNLWRRQILRHRFLGSAAAMRTCTGTCSRHDSTWEHAHARVAAPGCLFGAGAQRVEVVAKQQLPRLLPTGGGGHGGPPLGLVLKVRWRCGSSQHAAGRCWLAGTAP